MTAAEIEELFAHSTELERDMMAAMCIQYRTTAAEFFEVMAEDQTGLVIDGVPVYFGAVVPRMGNREIWTIVRRGVKEQKVLYRESRRVAREWARRFGPLLAHMIKSDRNQKWTERMGFQKVEERENVITYRLEAA